MRKKRERTTTAKGKEYKRAIAKGNFTKEKRAWRKELESTETTLADSADIQCLQSARTDLQRAIDNLTMAHDNFVLHLSPSKIETTTNDLEHCETQTREVVKSVNDRITEIRTELNSARSSRSRVSHASRSVRSRSSRASSSQNSTRLKRAEMMTKVVRLGTELEFLEIEKQRATELKRVQLMKELAASKAELAAAESFDKSQGVFPQDEVPLPVDNQQYAKDRLNSYLETQLKSVDGSVSDEHFSLPAVPVTIDPHASPFKNALPEPKITDIAPPVETDKLCYPNSTVVSEALVLLSATVSHADLVSAQSKPSTDAIPSSIGVRSIQPTLPGPSSVHIQNDVRSVYLGTPVSVRSPTVPYSDVQEIKSHPKDVISSTLTGTLQHPHAPIVPVSEVQAFTSQPRCSTEPMCCPSIRQYVPIVQNSEVQGTISQPQWPTEPFYSPSIREHVPIGSNPEVQGFSSQPRCSTLPIYSLAIRQPVDQLQPSQTVHSISVPHRREKH